MTDNELLLAISEMLDKKLVPIRQDVQRTNLTIENEIRPQIQLLAENYVPAAKRYEKEVETIAAMQEDIGLLKKVVREHSSKLDKVS